MLETIGGAAQVVPGVPGVPGIIVGEVPGITVSGNPGAPGMIVGDVPGITVSEVPELPDVGKQRVADLNCVNCGGLETRTASAIFLASSASGFCKTISSGEPLSNKISLVALTCTYALASADPSSSSAT